MAVKRGVKKRVTQVLAALNKTYPGARCTLDYRNPLQLMVATILSAQCTDKRVNIVTKPLFKKYRSVADFARTPLEDLEGAIRTTGFYRNKAKSIKNTCRDLVKRYGGKVPDRLETLVKLPGIGRKTANVILGNAFGIPGLVVDTHVGRLSRRLGWTSNTDAVKVEFDLMPLIPEKRWAHTSHLLIQHGRNCCTARSPDCPRCPVKALCPSNGKVST